MKTSTLLKLKNFCDKNDLRVGQFIWNIMADRCGDKSLWEAPEANPLFFITDEELEKRIAIFLMKQRPPSK